MSYEIAARFLDGEVVEALSLSERFYEKSPSDLSALLILWCLYTLNRVEQYKVTADIALSRFGSSLALELLYLETKNTSLSKTGVDQARQTLQQVPESHPLRSVVDMVLLRDSQSDDETLDACAARASSWSVPSQHQEKASGMLLRMIDTPERILQIAPYLPETSLTGNDRLIWVSAMQQSGDSKGAFTLLTTLSKTINAQQFNQVETLTFAIPYITMGLFSDARPYSNPTAGTSEINKLIADGSSASLHILGVLFLSHSPQMLLQIISTLPDSSSRKAAQTLTQALDGLPEKPLLELPPDNTLMLSGWLHRLLQGDPQHAQMAFRHLLGDQPSDEVLTSVSSALFHAAAAAAAHNHPKATLGNLVDILATVAPERAITNAIRATLALPDDFRPYARLSASERDIVQHTLAQMAHPGHALLERLPRAT